MDETKGSRPKLIANPRNNKFKYISDTSAHLGQATVSLCRIYIFFSVAIIWINDLDFRTPLSSSPNGDGSLQIRRCSTIAALGGERSGFVFVSL